MAKASSRQVTLETTSSPSGAGIPTILEREAAHFGALAADWWDPAGSSAMLHRLNPARLAYIRARIDGHFGTPPASRAPLTGKAVLDVGCGAGLLAEPLARLGGQVTAVDAAAENIAVATRHAAASGLQITYRHGDIANMALEKFDLITCMEVIEHVADPQAFLDALRQRLAPGGLLILSTPNRTLASRLLLVEAAERTGMVPRGTHDWEKFLTPEELAAIAQQLGLAVVDSCGLSVDVSTRGFRSGGSTALNYLMTLVHAA